MPIFYPIPHATNRTEALERAAKLCSRCIRTSFAGIRWREGLAIPQLTWAEVDAALAERERCAS